jgi:DNA-binding NtrC family response regulator
VSRRLLIVDDEPAILRALGRAFRRHGFEVRTASDGEEALAALDEFIPDVIISDFKMPGMTGGELLGLIGARFPSIRRILFSGFAPEITDAAILFFAKPYEFSQLLQACR